MRANVRRKRFVLGGVGGGITIDALEKCNKHGNFADGYSRDKVVTLN
jgi:hypothetical protein